MGSEPILAVDGLTHRFGGVAALADVALSVRQSESLAIAGENGAGKSTLIKILSGMLRPDHGTMRLEGQPYRPGSPAEARRAGVSVIHQELSIVPDLTVGENILIGRLPTRALGRVDRRHLAAEAREALSRLGLDIDPGTSAGALPIALQQMVEIAKGIASRARIIIMDEPTSSLGPREAERLWAVVGDLRRQGTTVMFVSHKLDEVLANADRVSVLKDGRHVATEPSRSLDARRLVTLMVGRDLAPLDPSGRGTAGGVVLKVEALSRPPAFEAASLSVRRGEIVGIAGLVGAGRTELVRAIFGADRPTGGRVEVEGRPLAPGRPRAAIAAGLGLVTESRKDQGLFLDMDVQENMSLPGSCTGRLGFLSKAAEKARTRAGMQQLGVVARSERQRMRTLSGGNQQKVILARWLRLDPKVLIVDEPTRGIDVGARAEIYGILRAQAAAGRAIIVVSSELPEILALATRVLVMRAGRIVGELKGEHISDQAIGRLAVGA